MSNPTGMVSKNERILFIQIEPRSVSFFYLYLSWGFATNQFTDWLRKKCFVIHVLSTIFTGSAKRYEHYRTVNWFWLELFFSLWKQIHKLAVSQFLCRALNVNQICGTNCLVHWYGGKKRKREPCIMHMPTV